MKTCQKCNATKRNDKFYNPEKWVMEAVCSDCVPFFKTCNKCREYKAGTEFGATESQGGYFPRHTCADCVKESTAPLEKATAIPEIVLEGLEDPVKLGNKLSKYGLSLAQYGQMITQQNRHCAICNEDNTRLVIDHCHATGKVRGLLCQNCNHLLGSAKDNPDILKRASDYLKAGGFLP